MVWLRVEWEGGKGDVSSRISRVRTNITLAIITIEPVLRKGQYGCMKG